MPYKTVGTLNARLAMGDCMEIMRDIPDGTVDMILCDLPYGTTACEWDSILPLDEMWNQYRRITKENAAIVLTAQTPFDKILGASNLKELRYEWIWLKESATGGMNANKMPLKKHENVLVFYRKLPTYNPQFDAGTPYKMRRNKADEASVYGKTGTKDDFEVVNPGRRHPTTELQFDCERGYHPTQKPVPLMAYLIKTYTNPGELVLDNTMGSGSTGVAAVLNGRKFWGIENDPTHFYTAETRIKRAESNPGLF